MWVLLDCCKMRWFCSFSENVARLLQNAAVCHDCNPTTHVAYHSLKEDIHEFKLLRRDGVGSGGRGTRRQTWIFSPRFLFMEYCTMSCSHKVSEGHHLPSWIAVTISCKWVTSHWHHQLLVIDVDRERYIRIGSNNTLRLVNAILEGIQHHYCNTSQ